MAVVTDKIKSVVDFLVRGFEPRESFEDLADEMNEEDGYEIQDNLALAPKYSYQPKEDTSNELKVVNHPNYRGYEVMVMEPRSFDDAAQIVQHLKDRKTIVLNLHLLDKEQEEFANAIWNKDNEQSTSFAVLPMLLMVSLKKLVIWYLFLLRVT